MCKYIFDDLKVKLFLINVSTAFYTKNKYNKINYNKIILLEKNCIFNLTFCFLNCKFCLKFVDEFGGDDTLSVINMMYLISEIPKFKFLVITKFPEKVVKYKTLKITI